MGGAAHTLGALLCSSWELLGQGFAQALTPTNLFFAFLGSLVGTLIGVLPGIGLPRASPLLLTTV